ncbi:MAG: hypothetical protein AAGE96_11715 [Cyanobacteria bacterium P01_G01_bin.19]
MNYIIHPILPRSRDAVIIDEAEYKEITDAQKLVWDILLVKEFFSYIVRNFLLLENKIQEIESKDKDNPDEFKEQCRNGYFHLENSHISNLLVMNLLTTCNSYLDSFYYGGRNKNKELFIGKDDIRSKLKLIVDQYYQKDIVYTLFKELRNYAQHHDNPIKGCPTNISQAIKIGFTIDVSKILKQANQENLRKYLKTESPNYSQKELEGYPKKLDIRHLTKEYIFILKNIHEEFNDKLDSEFKNSKNIIAHKVKYYCHNDSPSSAFEIYKQNEENGNLERLDISLSLFDDWEEVIEKYSNLDI